MLPDDRTGRLNGSDYELRPALANDVGMVDSVSDIIAESATGAAAEMSKSIRGIGASFPGNVYMSWAANFTATYCALPGWTIPSVSYEMQSSTVGLNTIRNGAKTYSFIGSDLIPTSDDIANLNLVVIPAVQGCIVIGYNIPRLTPPLLLTRQNIVDIFMGRITSWNDPSLSYRNPTLQNTFPTNQSPKIQLVLRTGGSGTSRNFMRALTAFDPTVPAGVSTVQEVTTATSALNASSRAATEILLSSIPWSITFMSGEDAALSSSFDTAAVVNRNGDAVAPSIASVQASQSAGDDWAVDIDSPNPGAYPLTAKTYYVLRNDTFTNSETIARGTVQYLWWTLNRGQTLATQSNFAPLTDGLLDGANEILNQVTFKGSPLSGDSLCDWPKGSPKGCKHGQCQTDLPFQDPQTACICDPGWMNVYNKDCSEAEYQVVVDLRSGKGIIAVAMIVIACFIITAIGILIHMYRARPAIKVMPASCAYVILAGCFVVVMGGLFNMAVPTRGLCYSRLFPTPVGAGVIFSTAIAGPRPVVNILDDGSQLRTCTTKPGMEDVAGIFEGSGLIITGILMLVCLYFAFLTRNVERPHGQSRSVVTAVLLVIIVTVFGLPIAIHDRRDPSTQQMAQFIQCLIYIGCAIMLAVVIHAPRLIEAIFDQKAYITTTLSQMANPKRIHLSTEWEGDEIGFTCFVYIVKISDDTSSSSQTPHTSTTTPPTQSSPPLTTTLLAIPDMDLLLHFQSLTTSRIQKAFKLSQATYRFPNLMYAPTGTAQEKSEAARVVFRPGGKSGKEVMTIEFASIERMQAFKTILEAAAFKLASLRPKEGEKSGGGGERASEVQKGRRQSDVEFLRMLETRGMNGSGVGTKPGLLRGTASFGSVNSNP
ncbi:hypothetical protein HDV00_010526 [Rhizophlyctis rosea]|nr:hypothetical protein HDV00_010526 [Rhizophlyctis rosea]